MRRPAAIHGRQLSLISFDGIIVFDGVNFYLSLPLLSHLRSLYSFYSRYRLGTL